MPSRDEVKALLDQGHSYEMAGRALGIPAGLAYMIATGLPAEGSDSVSPTRNEHVLAWVRERVARDLRGEA